MAMPSLALLAALLMLVAIVGVIVVLVLLLVNPKTRALAVGFVALCIFGLIGILYLSLGHTTVMPMAERTLPSEHLSPEPLSHPPVAAPPQPVDPAEQARVEQLSDDVAVPGTSESVTELERPAPTASTSPASPSPARTSRAEGREGGSRSSERETSTPKKSKSKDKKKSSDRRRESSRPQRSYRTTPADTFVSSWALVGSVIGVGVLLVLLYRGTCDATGRRPVRRWVGHVVLAVSVIWLIFVARSINVDDARRSASFEAQEAHRRADEAYSADATLREQAAQTQRPARQSSDVSAAPPLVVSPAPAELLATTSTSPRPPEPDLIVEEPPPLVPVHGHIAAEAAHTAEDPVLPSVPAEAPLAPGDSHDELFVTGGPRPDWVTAGAGFSKDGKTSFTTIAIGPYASRQECMVHYQRELQNASGRRNIHKSNAPADYSLRTAIMEHLVRRLSPGNDWHSKEIYEYPHWMHLSEDAIKNRIIKAQYVEKGDYSVGDMYTLHLRLEFDDALPAELKRRYVDQVADMRLTFTALAGGLFVGFVGVIFGYLKLDTLTRGYYTWRLRIAALVMLLGIFGLGCALIEEFDRHLWLGNWIGF